MIELTKEQKIEFCKWYLNYNNSNYICLSLREYLIFIVKVVKKPLEFTIFNILDCFPELKNNFPEGYDFNSFFNSISTHYNNKGIKVNCNLEREKIIQKTLNDLLNENNAV